MWINDVTLTMADQSINQKCGETNRKVEKKNILAAYIIYVYICIYIYIYKFIKICCPHTEL